MHVRNAAARDAFRVSGPRDQASGQSRAQCRARELGESWVVKFFLYRGVPVLVPVRASPVPSVSSARELCCKILLIFPPITSKAKPKIKQSATEFQRLTQK